ncbi:diacylglycerol/lipid kinase family protein [Actinomadura scrupuli]|uniref:diacylglycerol/lipid kinase family protein n=1 Tax=Actinomadura scrupuli TaxID=559629 RepID=UPI003D98DA1B
MNPIRTAVIVNPVKVDDLDGYRKSVIEALAAAGHPEPHWLETTPEDPGTGQAEQALSEGAQLVYACGGDGTVRAVAEGLAGTGVPLAVLCAGTGNLLARNLGLTAGLEEAFETGLSGRDRAIDLGVADGHRFAVMAGMGIDAGMITDTPEPAKKRLGWPAYAIGVVRQLRRRPMHVTVRVDGGRPLRRRARMVVVGNVGELHAGLLLLPDAVPDDGMLDVLILSPSTPADWLRVAVRILRRHPGEDRRIVRLRGEHIEITTDRPYDRECDGEPIGAAASLTVRVEPGALLLRVPADDHDADDQDAGSQDADHAGPQDRG